MEYVSGALQRGVATIAAAWVAIVQKCNTLQWFIVLRLVGKYGTM